MTDDRRQHLETQFSAYLDDELSAEDRREIEALLERDAHARALLEQLQATIGAVQSLPRSRASGRLMESLRGQLEREALLGSARAVTAQRSRGPISMRWMTAAAVLALATTAGYLMWPIAQEHWRPNTKLALNDGQGVPRPDPSPIKDIDSPAFKGDADGISDAEGDTVAAKDKRELQEHMSFGAPPELGGRTPAYKEKMDEDRAKAVDPHDHVTKNLAMATPAAPAVSAFEAGIKVAEDKMAALGDVPGHTADAVVELVFADDVQQREAIARLEQRFPFRSAGFVRLPESNRAADFVVDVPSEQTVNNLVEEIRSSADTAQSVSVSRVSSAPDTGRTESKQSVDQPNMRRARDSGPTRTLMESPAQEKAEAESANRPNLRAAGGRAAPAPKAAKTAPPPTGEPQKEPAPPAVAEEPASIVDGAALAGRGFRGTRPARSLPAGDTFASQPSSEGMEPAMHGPPGQHLAAAAPVANQSVNLGRTSPSSEVQTRPAAQSASRGGGGGLGGFGGFGGFGGGWAAKPALTTRPADLDQQVFQLGTPATAPAHVIRVYLRMASPMTQPENSASVPAGSDSASRPGP